jgi:hypothetical protein
MRLPISKKASVALFVGALAAWPAAYADFEVTAPDGRRLLLKDDGTWRPLGTSDKDSAGDPSAETGVAILRLERKTDAPPGCRLALKLVNTFPYEIRSLVLSFSALRPTGVVYETISAGFFLIKPGDSQSREAQFQGITCPDIARVQVGGGDRCVMGDLDRYSIGEGVCLAQVRVVASDLMRFEK